MKINSFVHLALLGLIQITAAEEPVVPPAGGEAAAEKIKFFWSATKATTSEALVEEAKTVSDDGASIMSSCFGLQSCAGFRQSGLEMIYSAREWNCNVKRSQTETGRKDTTSAVSLNDFELFCPQIKTLDQLPRPYDAMPTTFNFPVMYKSLDINGDDFVVTLADGTFTRPKCAILDPANEGNEMHTVTLIGHFGGRDVGQWPNSIRVVGDLKLWDNVNEKAISAKGLKLDRDEVDFQSGATQYGQSMSYESGLVMLKAWMYEFTEKGETLENHCRIDFPETTHVIKILFNGGPTKDGYHPMIPSDTAIFNVMMPRGQTLLWSKFLGLADLGTDEMWKEWPQNYDTDGDNYIDLCLRLAPTDKPEDIQGVMIVADRVFPPRGTGKNISHVVGIDHIKSDGTNKAVYPYALEMETAASKIYAHYLEKGLGIAGVSGAGILGSVGLPLLGLGLGAGLLFLQAFVKPV